jgi:intein-encoded DNA endonuclease-like protein
MCEVYNQDIGSALSKYTKPYSDQLELTHEAARAFLKGIFDSEGSICLNKQHKCCGIRLGNTDQKLIKYIRHLLLNLFDIHVNISQSKTPLGNPYYTIGIYKKEHRDIFKSKIGFSIDRKQSRL